MQNEINFLKKIITNDNINCIIGDWFILIFLINILLFKWYNFFFFLKPFYII